MQAQERRAVQRKQDLDVISVRRNPYLVDFEEERRLRRAVNGSSSRPLKQVDTGKRRAAVAGNGSRRQAVEVPDVRSRKAADQRNRRAAEPESRRNRRSLEVIAPGNYRPTETANRGNYRSGKERDERSCESLDLIDIGRGRKPTGKRVNRPVCPARKSAGRQVSSVSAGRRYPAAAKSTAKRCRRKQRIRRKLMAAAWVLCIFLMGWLFLLKKGNASELEQSGVGQRIADMQEGEQSASSAIIQGISSDQYAKHPAWTEDFLPINEYSRPGETLPVVRDIFVHYTANPGTSAAQNHSYFEQQKDMHEASVSAHFIIGYEGEIIQCVPLDEIAYAVQTRNYDSISIECCHESEDGSFTKATYDSLISLLAWLTDTYGLDTDHILRHYDCGGKKCPLYYTEHEDAWTQLKADVASRQENGGRKKLL